MAENTLARNENRFYVYVIFRPNGIPCYVGKGCGGRWQQHVKNAHNPHLANIYRLAGYDLPITKIRDGLSESEAFEIEAALIFAIGREICGGPLVNLTSGGDGVSGRTGWHHSAQTRAKIGRPGRSKSPHQIMAQRNWYARLSLEQRAELSEKISAGRKGKGLGRKLSPENRAKLIAANTDSKRSADSRQKMSMAALKRCATPEGRARMSVAGRVSATKRVARK